MTNLFYIQLITSFFVGGIAIALLSFFAEKANKKIAGIILSLPSTVVISYFFIGWVLSPQAVSDIVPTSLAADGSVLMFTIVYIYLSKIKLGRILSIITSVTGGLTTWFVLSIPLAVIKFDNLVLSLGIYFIAVLVSYYFLTYKNKIENSPVNLTYTNSQKVGRAIFVGLIISLAVLLSKIINPFWGGIFSSFPAAFLSTFVVLQWYYGSKMLFKIAKAVPAGSIVYVTYILIVHWSFPAFGIIFGSISAYAISLIIFFILRKFINSKEKSRS